MPGYWVAVVGAMLLVLANHVPGPSEWVVQALVLQTYVPDGLIDGFYRDVESGHRDRVLRRTAIPGYGPGRYDDALEDEAGRWRRQRACLSALALIAQRWRAYAYTRPEGPGLRPDGFQTTWTGLRSA